MKQGSNNEGTSTKYLSLVIIVIIVIKCLQEVIINVTSLARAFVISFYFFPEVALQVVLIVFCLWLYIIRLPIGLHICTIHC